MPPLAAKVLNPLSTKQNSCWWHYHTAQTVAPVRDLNTTKATLTNEKWQRFWRSQLLLLHKLEDNYCSWCGCKRVRNGSVWDRSKRKSTKIQKVIVVLSLVRKVSANKEVNHLIFTKFLETFLSLWRVLLCQHHLSSKFKVSFRST